MILRQDTIKRIKWQRKYNYKRRKYMRRQMYLRCNTAENRSIQAPPLQDLFENSLSSQVTQASEQQAINDILFDPYRLFPNVDNRCFASSLWYQRLLITQKNFSPAFSTYILHKRGNTLYAANFCKRSYPHFQRSCYGI